MLSALLGRSVPPERVPPDRLPDRHEQPPARTHRHKHELARAAAPCWNVERAAKFPPVPGRCAGRIRMTATSRPQVHQSRVGRRRPAHRARLEPSRDHLQYLAGTILALARGTVQPERLPIPDRQGLARIT
jgi:hypothetical protein